MNKLNLSVIKIITLSLVIALCACPVRAADTDNEDALLNMLPENCVFCVRINNFNGTLGKLDQYLAGASPVPMSLAMMMNMQLGAIIGDPMLTGINQGGDFAVFGVFPSQDQNEPIIGTLIPVTNYKTFVETNPNCKEGDDGIAILSSPNSPAGSFALTEAGNGNYAMVVSEGVKTQLPMLKEALRKSSKTLAQKLSPAQTKTAATSPAWAYVNMAGLYEKYNKDALAGLETLQQKMKQDIQKEPAEMSKMMGMLDIYTKMLPEILEEFGGGLDSASIALAPEPTTLTLDLFLKAKDGSELAKVFVKNPEADGNYQLTGYLNDNHAVNGLMKMNIPSIKKFYDMIFKIIDDTTDDSKFKEQMQEFKKSLDTTYDAMGDEAAFSFSYAGGTPPFKFHEVIEINKPEVMKEYMQNSMGFVGEMYKSMGIPMELKYEPAVATYKNATIDSVSFLFTSLDDPNDTMKQELEKIYGKDGLKYYFAQTPDKFYMTMGSDSEQTLKTLIDVPASGTAPAGDMKIAMDALQGTGYDDFACSINVIKLMQGIGEMMQTINQPGMGPDADMFAGLKDVQSQSCLVMGGSVADGQTSLRLAVPKQHLVEIATAAMQIQQQKMKAQQEKMQNSQTGMMPQASEDSMGGVSQQSPETGQKTQQNPLQSWVGKPAPELKMVDLDDKVHRISRLKGKKVILDFWATWCPPCKKAIPDLIKLADSGNADLVILGLSNEPADKLAAFAKEAKMNYPVIAYNNDLPAPYGQVTGIPTVFLIDSEGIIQDVLVGYHEPEELQSRLKELK